MAGRPVRRARRESGELAPGTRQPADPMPVHDAAEKRATGYSWESFQPGNYLGLRHGAFSPRVVGRLAEARARDLFKARPDLAEYVYEVGAWARFEAVAALLFCHLDQQGVVDEAGEPRVKLLQRLASAERDAAKRRDELGLGPASKARLERERADAIGAAFDVGALVDKGRQVQEVLATREIGPDDDDIVDDVDEDGDP
jgi:hypothetical protein